MTLTFVDIFNVLTESLPTNYSFQNLVLQDDNFKF